LGVENVSYRYLNSPTPEIASELAEIEQPQKTAKTSHLWGHKLRSFKEKNPVFKPNIGDFGAYFYGININALFGP